MTTTLTADPVIVPQAELAPPPVPAPGAPEIPPEIAYLRQHGMGDEATSLQGELETLLRSRDTATPPIPTQAPITQAPPLAPDAPLAPTAPQTAQEKALDPYAPEGAESGDVSVVIDGEGRARDAQTGRYVPIKALHHERDQHKQTRHQLAEMREQHARAEERLTVLNELLSADTTTDAAPPPAPPPPAVDEELVDPEVDIFKFAKQMVEREKRRDAHIRELEGKLTNTQQSTQQQIEAIHAGETIRSDVNGYMSRNPDFLDAYSHLKKVRDGALQALGYADKAARDAHIVNEERALAASAIRGKKSYAEIIYNLALAHGYQKSQPAPTPAPAALAPAPAPATNAQAAAKIESIRNGKELAGPTLTGAGGSAAEGLTVSQLANMSEAEFLNLAAKLGGKGRLDTLLRGA